jgi:hypothetical protein
MPADAKAQARKQSACSLTRSTTFVPERFCAENMYPIIMISSSPTSLITMYNVRRFLQESMYVLPRSVCCDMAYSNKYPLTPTDSSRQQRHGHVLLQRVPLGQRISYPSIGSVRQSNLVAKHAQAPNDIMLSTRLRLSISSAQTRGIVLSAFLQRVRSGNSGLTNGVSHVFCSITVSVGLAVRGYPISLNLMVMMGSERYLCVMGERPAKSKGQGLECNRTQGEPRSSFRAVLAHPFGARPD